MDTIEEKPGRVHELKTHPTYFAEIWEGHKLFEIRKADRPFQVGDFLFLREYDNTDGYTLRTMLVKITFIMAWWQFAGLKEDFCALGIKVLYRYADTEISS